MPDNAISQEPQTESPDLLTLVQEVENPSPITPESVVSNRPAEKLAPDSAILSSRLNALFEPEERQQGPSPDEELARLREELRLVRSVFGGEHSLRERHDAAKAASETPQDLQGQLAAELKKELQQMKEAQEALQTQLRQKEQEKELTEVSREVSRWVEANAEHFPLINGIGQQDLVFQKMWNTKNQTGFVLSETQAASDIEKELASVVERLAPILGFQKREPEAKREEEISPTTGGLNIMEPVDRDSMSDAEWLQYLIRNAQG
jgi:hypothetical protein